MNGSWLPAICNIPETVLVIANSARAWAAYRRSTDRRIEKSDLVLVHCNSFVDGFWTDVTRTFCSGAPGDRMVRMYDALFDARRAAIAEIRPGIRASAIDRAARTVLTNKGFGDAFRHPTGHAVGFSAINHNALPRIPPCSEDVLQPGMVFNIEPAIYIDGFGGLRHCDMVLVTESGCEVLTPFQSRGA